MHKVRIPGTLPRLGGLLGWETRKPNPFSNLLSFLSPFRTVLLAHEPNNFLTSAIRDLKEVSTNVKIVEKNLAVEDALVSIRNIKLCFA